MKKKKIYVLASVIIAIIIIILLIITTNNNDDEDLKDSTKVDTKVDVKESKYTYLVISINPKIMIKINDNIIIEVYQLNDDAIIFTNKDLQGLNLENGIKKIIEVATDNDYIKNDTEIKLSIYKYKDEETGKIQESVYQLANNYFIENGIHIVPHNIPADEQKEILNIIEDYKEKTKDIISNEDNNSTETEESQNTNETNNNDSESNYTENPTPPTPSNPTPPTPSNPTNLDINKVYGDYAIKYVNKPQGLSGEFWKKMGFDSPKAYYNSVVEQCNTTNQYNATQCNMAKYRAEMIFNDYYYNEERHVNISRDYGILIGQETIFLPINSGGAGGREPIEGEITITSDTSKYYIKFKDLLSGNNDFINCSASSDLNFTCDKPIITDCTGKKIYTMTRK